MATSLIESDVPPWRGFDMIAFDFDLIVAIYDLFRKADVKNK